MYNWSVDEKKLKFSPQEHKIWKLEQMINFGLNEEKIDINDLKNNFSKLHIDSLKRNFLEFLINN